MADRFLIGTGNRSVNTTDNWSTTSGGSSGASVPGSSDAVIIDANSSTADETFTLSVDLDWSIASFTSNGASNNFTLDQAGFDITCTGDFLFENYDGSHSQALLHQESPDGGDGLQSTITVGGDFTTNNITQNGNDDAADLVLSGTAATWRYRADGTNDPWFRRITWAPSGGTTTLRCQNGTTGNDIVARNYFIFGGGTLAQDISEDSSGLQLESHNADAQGIGLGYTGTGTMNLANFRLEHEKVGGGYGVLFSTDNIAVSGLQFLDLTGGDSTNVTWNCVGDTILPTNCSVLPEKNITLNLQGYDFQCHDFNAGGNTDNWHLICGNGGTVTVTGNLQLDATESSTLHVGSSAITITEDLQIDIAGSMTGWVNGSIQINNATPAAATTYYFSNAGNDTTGDGTEPTPWATFAKAITVLATGVRCIFNKGDTFAIADATSITATGGEIGAYGTGADPIFTIPHGGTLSWTAGGFDWNESTINFIATDDDIEAGFTSSRTSGAAPCAVFFDALEGGTRGANTTSAYDVSDANHELDYTWSFGDGSAAWTNKASANANRAKGSQAAHVFEDAGSYAVILTVKDSAGNTNTASETITVTSPSWTDIYADASAAGANDGTSETDAYTNLDTALADLFSTDGPRRLQVKRGETFAVTDGTYTGVDGPFLITTYGSGAKPIWTVASTSDAGFQIRTVSDLRIVDQDIRGPDSSGQSGIEHPASTSGDHNLILRVDVSNFESGITTNGNTDRSLFFCVDSTIDDMTEYGFRFNYGMHCGFVANLVSNCGQTDEHAHRCAVTHSVISHSTYSDITSGNHQLKFRGWDAAQDGRPTPRNEYNVISDNTFNIGSGGSAGSVYVQIGPHDDNASGQQVEDNVFERNSITTGGTPVGNVTTISINGSENTVRNNIVTKNDSGTSSANFIDVVTRGSNPAPNNCRVYNNSLYAVTDLGGGNEYRGVRLVNGTGHVYTNNIIAVNDDVSVTVDAINDSTTATKATNAWLDGDSEIAATWTDADNGDFTLLEDAQGRVAADPTAATTPANLIEAATQIDGLFDDYDGTARDLSTADIGAQEYVAGAPASSSGSSVAIRHRLLMD